MTASGLIVDAAQSANFASTNNVGTLAGNIANGSINFIDGRALTIGSVPAVADVAAQSGLFANLNVILTTTSGGVAILSNITADPGGNLLVTSAGPIAVNGVVTLTATDNVVLGSTGAFTQTRRHDRRRTGSVHQHDRVCPGPA